MQLRICRPVVVVWLTFVVFTGGVSAFELSSPTTYAILERTGPDGPTENLVHIYLAQGEMHNAVVMVDNRSADAENMEFRAYLSPLEETGHPLPEEAIKLDRLVHLLCRVESADQILPLTSVDVVGCPAGECRYLWLTVDGRQLPAGEYHTQVYVESLTPAIQTQAIDVVVTVWPFAIPQRLPVAVFTWDYGKATSSDEWLEEFLQHKVNSWHLLVSHREGGCSLHSDGALAGAPDFSALADNIRRGKPHGVFVIESWSWRGCPWPTVNGGEVAYMSPAWQRGFSQWLQAFVEFLKNQGLDYSQWFWYPYDESMDEGFLEQIKLIHEIDPNIQVFVDSATSDPAEFKRWLPYVDVWCPSYAYPKWPVTLERIKLIREHDRPLWNYFCGTGIRPIDISDRYRRCGWLGRAWELDGITFWTPTAGPGGVMNGVSTATVYDSPRGILGTRRWEAWRDGLEDYQYCDLLQQLAQKAEPAIIERELSQLQDTVNQVLSLGERYERGHYSNPIKPGESAEEAWGYEEARAKLARAIMRLSRD